MVDTTENSQNSLDPLMGLAVWWSVSSAKDLELVLLKGHLMLELILSIVLDRKRVPNSRDFSFHRKISALKSEASPKGQTLDIFVELLTDLNKLRNRLAHETLFDVHDGDLEAWSNKVFENFEGKKYTRFTYRTKIAHSFSVLAENLVEYSTRV